MLLPLLASLQQYLPFTVLKLSRISLIIDTPHNVATVLTVYGIETPKLFEMALIPVFVSVATVLTVYGIETKLVY